MVKQIWLRRRNGRGRDGEPYQRYDAEDGSMNLAVLSDEFTDKAEWAVIVSGDGIATTDRFAEYQDFLTKSRAVSVGAKMFAATMREKQRQFVSA